MEYQIYGVYIKSPSEHSISGLNYGFELQVEGHTSSGGSAVLITFLEENTQLHNEELLKIGIGNGQFKKMKNLDIEKIRSRFHIDNLMHNDGQFLTYSGQSTNGSCPYSLILINLSTTWISHEQYRELGENKQSYYKAKKREPHLRIFQNFVDESRGGPLSTVFTEREVQKPICFPVPLPFKDIMYNPDQKVPLGKIPYNDIPYWKKIPPNSLIVEPPDYPFIRAPYKLQLFYYHLIPKPGQPGHDPKEYNKLARYQY